MTMVEDGPVIWPYAAVCDAASLGLTPVQWQGAVDTAVEWIWSKTGRRFGTRTVVLRPQSRGRSRPWWPLGMSSIGMWPMGAYTNLWGGRDVAEWSPEYDQVLELPAPVLSIESVSVVGVPLDPASWRQEGNFLVRQDGGFWPRTQNMIAALGQPDTWSVTFTRGYPVSPWGQMATGKLICWIGKQILAGQPCAVPYNATTVTRGGVTINRDIRTASKVSPVPEVDQWIEMVNPAGLASEPQVWTPDVDRGRWAFTGSYYKTAAPRGMSVGDITALAEFLVLGPNDPVPDGTPAGTVLFRTD